MRFAILIAVVVLTPNLARAEGGGFRAGGNGVRSCGEFIAAAAGNPPGKHRFVDGPEGRYMNEVYGFQQWLSGFVGGYNAAYINEPSKQIMVDAAGLDLWMRNWCNSNPTDSVVSGIFAFRNDMQRR